MSSNQMLGIKGGQQMSKGYAGGSPSNGQNGYDTADKTGSGSSVTWDHILWYDMCGNPTPGHLL